MTTSSPQAQCRKQGAAAKESCCCAHGVVPGTATEGTSPVCSDVSPSRPELVQRGLRLEYLTVSWNVVEGLVSVAAALTAGSVALLGFGIDGFVETTSGLVLIWRLRAERHARNPEEIERLDQRAHKLVATKQPKNYDQAVKILMDLRDLAARGKSECSRAFARSPSWMPLFTTIARDHERRSRRRLRGRARSLGASPGESSPRAFNGFGPALGGVQRH